MNTKTSSLPFGLIIFFITFFVLGVPFSKMGFDSDCFGLVFLSSQIADFKSLFLHMFNPVQSSYEALNEVSSYQTQGCLTYFRPLMTLSHYVCYQLFGLNAYAYHLVNAGLHAITASLVFAFFTNIIPIGMAFLIALFFAFFPALTPAYIGVTSHVVPTYFFAALMILSYQRFLQTNRQRWQLIGALFFLLSLFCYEIIIVFPIILAAFLLVFTTSKTIDFRKIVQQSYAFWGTLGLYCLLRLHLLATPGSVKSFSCNIRMFIEKMIFNWYQAIKPFWGFQNFSKLSTIVISLLCASIIMLVFARNKTIRKKILFYVFSFFILAWPISVVTSDGRYFYPAIPVFIFMIYIALVGLTNKISGRFVGHIITGTTLFVGIVWGAWHGSQALIIRSFVTSQRDKAFQRLARDYSNTPNLRLIMVGTLHCFNNDTLLMQQGMTQAARLFFNNPTLEAYHVTQAKIFSHKKTMQSFAIAPLKNGFRFTSPDEENLFFMIPHAWEIEKPLPFSMGTILVHKKSAPWKASDISFLFDEQWLKPEDKERTIFVTFDLATWSFLELYLGEKI